MQMRRVSCLIPALALVLGAAGPSCAQDLTVPSEWAGVWTFQTTQWPCGHPELALAFSFTDTMCAGDAFSSGGESPLQCTGTIESGTVTMECSGVEVVDGCTQSYELTQQMTLSGETFSGTGTMNVTFAGTCDEPDPLCLAIAIAGTRIGEQPPDCHPQAEEGISWGTLKGLYR